MSEGGMIRFGGILMGRSFEAVGVRLCIVSSIL